jgi:hypothetical protein
MSKITTAKWTRGAAQVPALQVQSPQFKPQSHKKENSDLAIILGFIFLMFLKN